MDKEKYEEFLDTWLDEINRIRQKRGMEPLTKEQWLSIMRKTK